MILSVFDSLIPILLVGPKLCFKFLEICLANLIPLLVAGIHCLIMVVHFSLVHPHVLVVI